MTVSRLYAHVAQLGFEESLEDDARFYYSLNRALLQAAILRPKIAVLMLDHRPLQNALKTSSFAPVQKKDEDLIYEADDAKAYYFESDGNGVAYVEHFGEDGWKIVGEILMEGDGKNFHAFRGLIRDGETFLTGRVRIRFCGEYLYSVRSVALYQYVFSNRAEDIPAFEPFTGYDISALAERFLSLEAPPIDESTGLRLHEGYDVESDRVILLPYDTRGVFRVRYRQYPEEIPKTLTAAEDETELPFDEEICSVLPLVVAAYIWADDEPEKAQYYMTLYRERAAEIRSMDRDNKSVIMRNAYGW